MESDALIVVWEGRVRTKHAELELGRSDREKNVIRGPGRESDRGQSRLEWVEDLEKFEGEGSRSAVLRLFPPMEPFGKPRRVRVNRLPAVDEESARTSPLNAKRARSRRVTGAARGGAGGI